MDNRSLSRRTFLGGTSATVASAAFAPYLAARNPRPGGAEMLRVGLVGCGGRGGGAASDALHADANVKLVAMGDVFADHLEAKHKELLQEDGLAGKIDVPPERRFVGFDAYQKVIEASDVVLLCTTPHFRPLHMRAAVEAGKHLFVEKPVAVDAPGVRSVLESARMAREKKLNVVSGLCYRYMFAKQAVMERVHGGDIGEIVAMETTYNTGALWHRGRKPEWSDMEWQIRNWLYFTWLSGDHIAEQHIHSLDKIAWAMKDESPVKATSSGGRVQRVDPMYGNVYDHFNTVFEWKNGVRAFSSCRQWTDASTDVSDHVYGTNGVAHLQEHKIRGPKAWSWRDKQNEPDDMYRNEHVALFAAIRADKVIDNSQYMANSTLMAIQARMAAYTGQTITWEQALNSTEDLSPKGYAWGSAPVARISIPGVTKFA
ncbi:MAG TPA: Gfo/Idh/MocA family oxidoreductase [Planctomycetota bacterium]|nr:Gfo/Idh/MocA family oxidoreductase [Planctomycetota bacterium]